LFSQLRPKSHFIALRFPLLYNGLIGSHTAKRQRPHCMNDMPRSTYIACLYFSCNCSSSQKGLGFVCGYLL
jgi:hypothetical protein